MNINQKDRYKIKEFCRHEEAASVKPMLVETKDICKKSLHYFPRRTGVLRQDALTLYNTTGLVHSYQALPSASIDFIVSSWSLRVSEYFGQLP